jgi:hypothetical protein
MQWMNQDWRSDISTRVLCISAGARQEKSTISVAIITTLFYGKSEIDDDSNNYNNTLNGDKIISAVHLVIVEE